MLREALPHPPPPPPPTAVLLDLEQPEGAGMEVCAAALRTAARGGGGFGAPARGPGAGLTGDPGTVGPLPGVFLWSHPRKESWRWEKTEPRPRKGDSGSRARPGGMGEEACGGEELEGFRSG